MVSRNVKESVRQAVIAAGACRVGFAEAVEVDDSDIGRYIAWLRQGKHGGMDYLKRYIDIRRNPVLLLDEAKTVICCAFDYRPSERHRLFADYALGLDYHEVIRQRLNVAAETIRSRFGGSTRICVDTAPVRERYWAARSGVGFLGLNGQLIVEGIGSKVFLAEILWTEAVEADASRLDESCCGCRACVSACPGHALDGSGALDAMRCLSYLTIEHRGELPDNIRFDGRIYGCDICQDVCPYNKNTHGTTAIDEFKPSREFMALDIEDIKTMDPGRFKSIFSHSAVQRAKLSGLRRNALRYMPECNCKSGRNRSSD